MGCRDVACNVSLSIMVFLPPDHVIVGMEYGDVARYVSTCRGILPSGAIIIGFYHRGGLCVVCSSCHRSAVPNGDGMGIPWVSPVPWVSPTAVVLRTYGALYGAQQRFSVTGDFWGDVSEETDYISPNADWFIL